MAVLSAAKRKKIPKQEYGLPGEKKYPMPDKSHAANAKARASEMVNKGKLSASSEAKIDAKANKVLGKGKSVPSALKGEARTKKEDPNGTHNDGGVMYHNSMKGTHDMPVEHTSDTR